MTIVKQTTTGAVEQGRMRRVRRARVVRAGSHRATVVPVYAVDIRVVERPWSLREAVDLVRAGYTLEHTSARTGYPQALIRSHL
jgi:hypothetical protein